MIAQLTGTLTHKSPQQLVLDVGGVGYAIIVSLNTFSMLPEEGKDISLAVHTYVREDQLVLYGFSSAEEKEMFGKLIAVSGIGPKVALAILSGLPPAHLATAITTEDAARLNAIPGVGKKTAERIIVDLKDKLSRDGKLPEAVRLDSGGTTYHDALSALTNLGYTRVAAEKALRTIDWSENPALETSIRTALKELIPQ